MTPRQKIFSLPSNMLVEEASAKVIERKALPRPCLRRNPRPEHIVGVVYSKDLARLMYFRPGASAQSRSREPGFCPARRARQCC